MQDPNDPPARDDDARFDGEAWDTIPMMEAGDELPLPPLEQRE